MHAYAHFDCLRQSLFIALADLELRSTCFCLLSSGIKSVCPCPTYIYPFSWKGILLCQKAYVNRYQYLVLAARKQKRLLVTAGFVIQPPTSALQDKELSTFSVGLTF